MAQVAARGLTFEYDAFGSKTDPALLLIMGVGSQMILWREDFCRGLADKGFHVIRYDNRDVGLTSKLDHLGTPDLGQLMAAVMTGQRPEAPYLLSDMADDAAAVMDALDLDTAHIVGASMGGMIAQCVALQHPDRVRSMTSIMSTTGEPGLPPAKPEAMAALLEPAPDQARETLVRRFMRTFRTIGSPGYPATDEELRATAEAVVDRSVHPAGFLRQLAAIMASPPRHEALAAIRTPSLVLHGADDPLVPVEAGKATARAIPGAKLVVVPGMGHDFSAALTPVYVREIGAFVTSVEGRA